MRIFFFSVPLPDFSCFFRKLKQIMTEIFYANFVQIICLWSDSRRPFASSCRLFLLRAAFFALGEAGECTEQTKTMHMRRDHIRLTSSDRVDRQTLILNFNYSMSATQSFVRCKNMQLYCFVTFCAIFFRRPLRWPLLSPAAAELSARCGWKSAHFSLAR